MVIEILVPGEGGSRTFGDGGTGGLGVNEKNHFSELRTPNSQLPTPNSELPTPQLQINQSCRSNLNIQMIMNVLT